MDYDEDGWKTNRVKKRFPKLGLHYCRCDRNLIGDGERCSVCGRKDPSKREKVRAR